MWLRVIREELAILDELAIGMIEDANLTMEEVELAISRSKIVVKEFEVLYKQLPGTQAVSESAPQDQKAEISRTPAEETPVSEIAATHEISVNINEPAEQPAVAGGTTVENDSSVAGSAHAGDTLYITLEVETMDVPVTSSPEATVPEMKVSPEPAEQNILNMEEIKEHQPQFKAAPLQSLKEGLSLNDRYLFQRELFDNDKSRLDETVAALDRQENIKEAVEYLKANFKWIKSEASEKFVHLVKRRFS